MARGSKVNVAVSDRILLHLLNNSFQTEMHTATPEVTRRGIAEACAIHPPNVSRSMRDLVTAGVVGQTTRQVVGESRRQKTWHLTPLGVEVSAAIKHKLEETMVLLRSRSGDLLEIPASQASERLRADLDILSILMHAQYEGALNYGDIRFGPVRKRKVLPGSIKMMAGAHATYHTKPPQTRDIHGRRREKKLLDRWFTSSSNICVITGVAGCGKTTLISNWFSTQEKISSDYLVMYYPCQTWDTATGLATSIIHRVLNPSGVSGEDPYNLVSTLPTPGNNLDYDLLRRRLVATMIDENDELSKKQKLFLILDDVHNLDKSGNILVGAMMQVAEASESKIVTISRECPNFYDRRDVLTLGRVHEIALEGLSQIELEEWIATMNLDDWISSKILHERTGGHPLAIELLEMYGEIEHRDWVKFLDAEIVEVLPANERMILMELAKSDRPVLWEELARATGITGGPPKTLMSRGLMIELDGGMWLHEALRSRLRMYVFD